MGNDSMKIVRAERMQNRQFTVTKDSGSQLRQWGDKSSQVGYKRRRRFQGKKLKDAAETSQLDDERRAAIRQPLSILCVW